MTTQITAGNVRVITTASGDIRVGDVFNRMASGVYRCVTTDGRGTIYLQAGAIQNISRDFDVAAPTTQAAAAPSTATPRAARNTNDTFVVRNFLAASGESANTLTINSSIEFRKLMVYVSRQTFTVGEQYTFFEVSTGKWKKARFARTSSDIGRATSGFALSLNASNSQKTNRLKRLNTVYGLGLTSTAISNSIR